jgi:3-(3-hydroxy-phenyl)propionate hydroxylase
VIESLDGVLVVGAGPVGLVTALQLARAGVSVRVVEGEAIIGTSPRAAGYHSLVVERLKMLQQVSQQISADLATAPWLSLSAQV